MKERDWGKVSEREIEGSAEEHEEIGKKMPPGKFILFALEHFIEVRQIAAS